MPKTVPPVIPPDWPATQQKRYFVPLARLLMFATSRYHAEGKENFPEPPFVIVINHLSFFDIPAHIIQLPFGSVGLAARKYKGTWRQWFFQLGALIWVTQFSADRDAIKGALKVLEHGVPVGIAAEGTRSKTGGLLKGTSGAAFVATRANVPIVPMVVWGTEKIGKRLRPRVEVRVGKPFRLPEGRAKGDQLDAYTERIMCAMAALLPEEYRGAYAGNPLVEEMAKIVCP